MKKKREEIGEGIETPFSFYYNNKGIQNIKVYRKDEGTKEWKRWLR